MYKRAIEYKISRRMFDEIVKTKKDKKQNSHTYVMNVINENFGLLGEVVKLVMH